MGCCTTIPAESQQQPVPNTKSTSQIPKYDLNEDHTVVQPLKSNEINTNDRSTPTKTDRVEELSAMRISKLKRILQKQIQLNESRLSDDEIKKYNFQKFIEKYEFVNAICTLENLNHCTSDNKEYDDYMRTNVIKDTMIKPQVSTVKLSPKDVRTNELKSKKVAQLKYLLRQYTTNLNDTNFIEKSEYVNAIIEFEFNGSIRTDANNITEPTYVNKKQRNISITKKQPQSINYEKDNTINKTAEMKQLPISDMSMFEPVQNHYNTTMHLLRPRYHEQVIQNLVNLGIGSRNQCIKASLLTVNYRDSNAVLKQLEKLKNQDYKSDEQQLETCSLSNCKHLKRLVKTLMQYHAFIAQNIIIETDEKNSITKALDINDIFTGNYDVISTLNDFNHLLNAHSYEFEEIYNILTNKDKICELSNCLMMRRNY
eukprot:455502_1